MIPRFTLAAVASMLVAAATAAASVTPAVTVTPDPASVQPGGTSTITAGMPVSDAGTVSQEIVQTIDPAKAVLTGASGITAPAGWTLSFFNGASWSSTPPANAAAWAQVSQVKTSGTINSQGSEGGYQIAAGTATGTAVSLAPATITAGGAGDGYQAFFDPARTRIFNVFHHKSGAALDCHVLATGATCAGFPFGTFPSQTGQYSTGRVVGTKIWIPMYKQVFANNNFAGSSVGFSCVDIAAVLASGGAPSMCSPDYVPLATGQDVHTGQNFTVASNQAWYAIRSIDGVSTAGSADETRLWSSLPSNGKVICLDTATAAPCAGMPTNGWSTAVKGWKLDSTYTTGGYFTSMVMSGGRIYVDGSSSTTNTTNGNLTIACVLVSDPSTECPGFTGGKDLGANSARKGPAMVGNLVELPAADGSTRGVCLLGDTRLVAYYDINELRPASSTDAVPCWDAAGSAFSGPASLSTMVTSAFSYGFVEYQQPLRVGSRIYWGNGVNFTGDANYPPRAFCWDASASSGAGGPCAGMVKAIQKVKPGAKVIARRPDRDHRRLDQIIEVITALATTKRENVQLIMQRPQARFIREDTLRGTKVVLLRYGPRTTVWVNPKTGQMLRFESSNKDRTAPIVVDIAPDPKVRVRPPRPEYVVSDREIADLYARRAQTSP